MILLKPNQLLIYRKYPEIVDKNNECRICKLFRETCQLFLSLAAARNPGDFLWNITANATADIATSHAGDSHSNELFKGLGMEKQLES